MGTETVFLGSSPPPVTGTGVVFVPFSSRLGYKCLRVPLVLQEQQHGPSCEHHSAAALLSGPDLSPDLAPLQPSSGQRNQLGSRDTAGVHTPGSA